MNYWIISTELQGEGVSGGIGTYLYHFIQTFPIEGNSLTVFLHQDISGKQIVESRLNDSIRLVKFNAEAYSDVTSFLGYHAAVSVGFKNVIQKYLESDGVPDVLESQDYQGIAYYVLQHKYLGYPLFKDLFVVTTIHTPVFVCYDYNHLAAYDTYNFWVGEMEQWVINATDIIISPSMYAITELQKKMNFWNKNHIVLPNPYRTENTAGSFQPGGKTITFVGKLSRLKGVLALFENLELLEGLDNLYTVNIIGSDTQISYQEKRTIGSIIKQKYEALLKTSRIKLLGALSHADTQKLIANSSVLVVPSLYDNYPYTVLEAMAKGLVVLVSKQGGHTEIIDNGVNGFVFDHFTNGDLAAKLKKILELSAEEILGISNNAKETIKSLELNTITTRRMRLIIDQKNKRASNPKDEYPFNRLNLLGNNNVITACAANMKLSIVVPYYNLGYFLKDTCASVLHSTYTDKEIIIVNDCSSDEDSINCLKEIESWQDSRIRIINQKINSGLPAARNVGASLAKGHFLAFVDADDMVDKLYFEKAVDILNRYKNVHFVGCWIKYFGESDHTWPSLTPEPPYILYHNMVNSSSLVYKREAFITSGLNDRDFIYGMEDYESVVRMISNGFGGVVIPEPLFNYRVRKNSMSRGFNPAKEKFLYNLIRQKNTAIFERFASDVVGLYLENGPGYAIDNPTFQRSQNSFFNRKGLRMVKNVLSKNPMLKRTALYIYSFLKPKI